jgi:hypothetical protein
MGIWYSDKKNSFIRRIDELGLQISVWQQRHIDVYVMDMIFFVFSFILKYIFVAGRYLLTAGEKQNDRLNIGVTV